MTVTNLNNSGPGSLREALETTGPVIIDFAISGTISLNSDISVKSHKTLDANGTYIRIRYFALRIDQQENIIIRNIHFASDGQNRGGSGDAITIINGSKNIWIDHCTFENFYDGLVDITEQSDMVTVSWCHFKNHDKTMLIGASDNSTGDIGKLHVTIHHNYFDGTNQRHPRSRFGWIHIFNNYFKDMGSYAIASCADAKTHIENNRFENVSRPSILSASSSWEGYITATGNTRINSGFITTRPPTFTPSDIYPYTPDVVNALFRDMMLEYVGHNTTTNLGMQVSGFTMSTTALARKYAWYKDGELISGATGKSYTAPVCGEYTLRIFGDQDCYKEFSHTFTADCAGICEGMAQTDTCGNCLLPDDPLFDQCPVSNIHGAHSPDPRIKVFPNPMQTATNICLTETPKTPLVFNLYQPDGVLLLKDHFTYPCHVLHRGEWLPGTYIFQLSGGDRVFYSGKIGIQ